MNTVHRLVPSTPPGMPMATDLVVGRGNWPANWVDHPDRPANRPSVALFRLRFQLASTATVRIHVSADNRYQLWLDGEMAGRGPERGDPLHWRYETYALTLSAGAHTLVAMSWWLGEQSPYAQMSIRPGFFLAADGAYLSQLSTGLAPWETAMVSGVEFFMPDIQAFYACGAKVRIDGAAFPWDWQMGEAGAYVPVCVLAPGMSADSKVEYPPSWLLTPATLPPMLSAWQQCGRLRYLTEGEESYPVDVKRHLATEAADWQAWLAGTASLAITAHTTRRAIIDLENYYCAYPHLCVSGGKGTRLSLQWAEALYEQPTGQAKGNRDEIAGKYFRGVGDEFIADGGARRDFTTLWWETGRYLELTVTTQNEPLTLESLSIEETRYPLEMEGVFRASDERLEQVIPIALRALQMCAHETYMDCPYYEQLMYVGDTRLEVLTTYAVTGDDRLPRKALTTFNESRAQTGLTQSRFPNRVTQFIPPFSLWWVMMVHDYWQWRDDMAFVRTLLPGVRAVSEYFRTLLRPDGLMAAPQGWDFCDWVPGWKWGIAPGADDAPSALLNLQLVLALQRKAALEEYFGEPALAGRDRETAATVFTAVQQRFWHAERGLFADDLAQHAFSEHTQCLAILTGLLPEDQRQRVIDGLLTAPDLARTTIYFTHYLFETLYAIQRPDVLLQRLTPWFSLHAQGFKTTFEEPEPSRSDCHAWGAHPLYHYYASILGIRPAGPGFHQVTIAPQLGTLSWAEGTMPHPQGAITVRLRRDGARLQAHITLPEGVTGHFVWGGENYPLAAGQQVLTV